MLLDVVNKSQKFAIYGAQVVAYSTYIALKKLTGRTPEYFIVTSKEGNPQRIDEIPVKEATEVSKDILIIVAVSELLQDKICEYLITNSFSNFFKINADEEFYLMSSYYNSSNIFSIAKKENKNFDVDYCMFEIKHHLDKVLNKIPIKTEWEVEIQAGAAQAETYICEFRDNTEENISEKNRFYSEATVMYWIWKNISNSWVGIEHYRRHLMVDKSMIDNDVDAILSLPYICYPNAKEHFQRFVGEDVVEILIKTLKEIGYYEYETYEKCLKDKYMYPYNLLVAKKSVYNDLCNWIFEITNHLEKLDLECLNNFRVLGYIVEQLTSIYFLANTNNLNIKHAKREIYV